MKQETRAFLDMAAGDLAAARRDLAADNPRASVSRAHYAAFHAACAALDSDALAAKTHAGTHTLFRDRFVRNGHVDANASQTLSHLMQLRQGADCHVGTAVVMPQAVDPEAHATAFVDAIEALLTGG